METFGRTLCSSCTDSTLLVPRAFQGIGEEGGAHVPSVCYSWAARISQGCPWPLCSSSSWLSGSFSGSVKVLDAHATQSRRAQPVCGKHQLCMPHTHCSGSASSMNHSQLLDVTPILLRQCPRLCLWKAKMVLEILHVKTDLFLVDFMSLRTFRGQWTQELSAWLKIFPWASYVSALCLVYSSM